MKITELQKIELKPGEVLVIKMEKNPGREGHRILERLFGKQYIVVSPGVEFSVISKTETHVHDDRPADPGGGGID